MPQKTTKNDDYTHLDGSRWHNFHFSGKVIMCSVLFGFLLVLVGGIVMAIGVDEEENKKPDQFDEMQPKAPNSFVGTVIMGIGGFTVVVGVSMCLFETMCRKRDMDSSPLIGNPDDKNTSNLKGELCDPTSIPSTSHYQDDIQQNREQKYRNKSSRSKQAVKRVNDGRKKNNLDSSESSSSSPSSAPIGIKAKNFMHTSDNFVTPSSSFVPKASNINSSYRDAENQTSASLIKSINSSGTWTVSTEFQTPSTSFKDGTSEDYIKANMQSFSGALNHAVSKKLENIKHEFVTPKNSNIDNSASSSEDENELNISNTQRSVYLNHTELQPGSSATSMNSKNNDCETSSNNLVKSQKLLAQKNLESNVLEDDDSETDETPEIAMDVSVKSHQFLTPKSSEAEILEDGYSDNVALQDFPQANVVKCEGKHIGSENKNFSSGQNSIGISKTEDPIVSKYEECATENTKIETVTYNPASVNHNEPTVVQVDNFTENVTEITASENHTQSLSEEAVLIPS